ncbi:MAG: SPASM domain-containing protein, partial [Firmicutes bacterium]|nr:SPASM domain-containing protein [Bacillota bacterium]
DFAASSGSAWGRIPDTAARVGRQWVGSKEDCRRCWARYRCSGGCHANAHAATGDVARPDPLGCQILRARLEAALYLEARLAMACHRQ